MRNLYSRVISMFILFALFNTTYSSLWSQVSGYSFIPLGGTYTPLVGGTATSLTATADDDISTAFPIGFDFVYDGATYTQLRANSNGLLTFNATGSTTTANNLSTTATETRPGLAPLWDDLQCSSGVTYQLNGVAPNRTLTVEWKNIEWNWSSSSNAISFQVILYETTNVIDFVYQQGPDAGNPAGSGGASIGLMGVASTDYLSLQNSSGSPTTSTTASTNNISVKPATGQIYRFFNCPIVAPLANGSSVCAGTAANLTATPNFGGSINWYDAATGGTLVGSGSPWTTPVLATTTSYFAAEAYGLCPDSPTAEAVVTVDPVVVSLTPVNVTCNGNLTGSFTQSSTQCGTGPFTYSIDGGSFGSIPTNMAAGTYSIVVMDASMATSSPISLTIEEPSSPYNISFVNVGYYSADVTWMSDGVETSWDVEIGPVGFTPGSGTTQTVSVMFASFTGLTESTSYDVYITPSCSGNETPGTAVLATNAGFFAWDNQCPIADFIDISSTGTDLILTDDSEAGITMPIPFIYQGSDVINLTVGNNGGVVLNTLTGNVGYGGVFTTLPNGTLFAWGDDLDDETGNVYWSVVGTSPNQIFIVQWDNSNNFSNGAGSVTFQMQFHETTNEIYYVYDDVLFGDSPADDYAGNADIGAAGTVDITVSNNSQTYLQNNSCVHFYYALCPNPVNPIVTSFQEEVIIDWSAGLYGETDWTVIYGPAGFDPATSGTTLTTSSPSINILGLTQITAYDVYIYSECMIDNLTSAGLLVEVQTLPWCNTPTGGTNTTAVDSLFANWNWAEVTGAPNALTGFNILYGNSGFDLSTGIPVVVDALDYSDTIVDADFLAGGVYQYYVQAECGTDTSNYAGPFTFVMPLSNDTVCGAEILMADGTVYTFNNTGATVGIGESMIAPGATGFQNETGWGNSTLNNTTWYMFEAPPSGNVRINHNASNTYAGQSAVYEVTDCGDYATFTLIAANDNSMVNNAAAPNYTVCGLTPGATYYLLHDGNSATTGNHVISIVPISLNAGTYSSTIDVCTGGDVNLFDGITGNDAGGVWTAMNAAASTQLSDSIWNSEGLAYNIPFEFEYRLTDGCAYDSAIALVEVFPLSSAGPDGSITVCRNEPIDLLSALSGNVDLGGVWYDPSNQPLANSDIVASNFPGQFNYDYITGNGVCPDDTALILVNVLSTCDYLNIQEMFFADMTIYPNPSNAIFNVANYGSTEVFSYKVTDIDGRVITSKEAAINGAATTEIDLKGKVTGVYFIKVYNENAEKTFRVVLQ